MAKRGIQEGEFGEIGARERIAGVCAPDFVFMLGKSCGKISGNIIDVFAK